MAGKFLSAALAGALVFCALFWNCGLGAVVKKGRFVWEKEGGLFHWAVTGNTGQALLLLTAVFLLGALRMGGAMETEEILKREGTPGFSKLSAQAEGKIESIQEKNGNLSVVLGQVKVKVGETWQKDQISQPSAERSYELKRLIVYLPEETEWQDEMDLSDRRLCPGMRLLCQGELESFEPARNEGEFDYQLYYRSKKLCCQMNAKRTRITGKSESFLKAGAYRFKEKGKEIFENSLDSKDAGILSAVILGDKSGIDEEINELYQKNGIAHLLAVSGLHVSFIGMGFYQLLRRLGLGFGKAGICAGGILIFYGVMTGLGPSVFRACLMFGCAVLAGYLGRTYDLLSAMALAAVCLTIETPFVIFTAAFQLSFGAVFAIGFAGQKLTDGLSCKRNWTKTLFMSAAIQLVTGPLVLYYFFEYPLYGMFLNFIVIPLMTYVVAAGIFGLIFGLMASVFGAAGFVLNGISVGCMGTCHYILAFYETLCQAVGRLPGSSLILGRPEIWKLAVYYLFLFLALIYLGSQENRKTKRRETLVRESVFLLFLTAFLLYHPLTGLRVSFLDVGQGDGILIETGKTVILVDGGSSQIRNLGKRSLEPVLKSRGIGRIHMAFLSHGDLDHMSGLSWLLENHTGIEIDTLLLPYPGKGQEVYEELEKKAVQRGTQVVYICAGDWIETDGLEISCLYPYENTVSADRNGHSEVLLVTYGKFSMLLTGDVEKEGEAEIVKAWNPEWQVQILKAGHHGSSTSSTEDFLDAVKPYLAVLSFGKDNSYGHPHQEVLDRMEERGIDVWSTKKHGMITVRTDGKEIWVKGFLPADKRD